MQLKPLKHSNSIFNFHQRRIEEYILSLLIYVCMCVCVLNLLSLFKNMPALNKIIRHNLQFIFNNYTVTVIIHVIIFAVITPEQFVRLTIVNYMC